MGDIRYHRWKEVAVDSQTFAHSVWKLTSSDRRCTRRRAATTRTRSTWRSRVERTVPRRACAPSPSATSAARCATLGRTTATCGSSWSKWARERKLLCLDAGWGAPPSDLGGDSLGEKLVQVEYEGGRGTVGTSIARYTGTVESLFHCMLFATCVLSTRRGGLF